MNGLHEPYYPALLRVRLSLTLTDSGNRAGVEPTHHPSKRTDRSFHFSYRFHVVDARPGGFRQGVEVATGAGCYVARFHPQKGHE